MCMSNASCNETHRKRRRTTNSVVLPSNLHSENIPKSPKLGNVSDFTSEAQNTSDEIPCSPPHSSNPVKSDDICRVKRSSHIMKSFSGKSLGEFKYKEIHFLLNLPQIAIEFLGKNISYRYALRTGSSNVQMHSDLKYLFHLD